MKLSFEFKSIIHSYGMNPKSKLTFYLIHEFPITSLYIRNARMRVVSSNCVYSNRLMAFHLYLLRKEVLRQFGNGDQVPASHLLYMMVWIVFIGFMGEH